MRRSPIEYSPAHRCTKTILQLWWVTCFCFRRHLNSKVKHEGKKTRATKYSFGTFSTFLWLFNTISFWHVMKASQKHTFQISVSEHVIKFHTFNFYSNRKIKMFSMAHHKCQVTVFIIRTCLPQFEMEYKKSCAALKCVTWKSRWNDSFIHFRSKFMVDDTQ